MRTQKPTPRTPPSQSPKPKRRAAAAAEAAPTQKQVLKDKPQRKRTLRNEGVDAAQ